MFHTKNTDYLNWRALFCLLLVSGVKGVIDSYVKENKHNNHEHMNFIHKQNHSSQENSDVQQSYLQSDIEFQTQIIPYEYIVKFSGFYKAENRQNFIDASLAKLDLSVSSRWPEVFESSKGARDIRGQRESEPNLKTGQLLLSLDVLIATLVIFSL